MRSASSRRRNTPVELGVLKAVLKATREGLASVSQVVEESGAPRQVVARQLQRLREEHLVDLPGGLVRVDGERRLRLLRRAVSKGGDLEETSKLLEWGEFERLVAGIAEECSFSTALNLRFKQGKKRWQVDLVAMKEPLVLCIDCKHLRSRQAAVLRRAAGLNAQRAKGLAEELPRLGRRLSAETWRRATVMPVMVTLRPAPWRTYEAMPIVPINQLNNFLGRVQGEAALFAGYSVNPMGSNLSIAKYLGQRAGSSAQGRSEGCRGLR